MTPPGCGRFSFIQNVMSFREIVFKDRSRFRLITSGFVLDGGDPYHCQFLGLFIADDSPAFGVNVKLEPRVSTMEVREEFRTFLMFQPKGKNRTTQQVAQWRWIGQARSNDPEQDKGTLELDAAISRVTPGEGEGFFTSTAPILSPLITDSVFVVDSKANPDPNSDANRTVEAFNKGMKNAKQKPGNVCKEPKKKPPGSKGKSSF